MDALSTRLEELQQEVLSLRRRLAHQSGGHELYYSLQGLATLFSTTVEFWRSRLVAGDLGPLQQPGGPVNLSPGSPRGDWRVPWSAVQRFLLSEPLPAPTQGARARTAGELKRKEAA